MMFCVSNFGFQGPFVIFKYFFSGFPLDLIVASYITLFCRPLSFSGHSYIVLKLQLNVVGNCGK